MSAALLVPCYHAVRYLPRLRVQVDRLAPAFDEVILADDGSTDATADEAERLGFRVIRLPANLGPGGARNALAAASCSEWIHFHDVDDELAPDFLAHVLPLADAGCDAVLHETDFIDEQTRALLVRWSLDPAALARDPAEALLRQPLPTMSSFLRRTVFLALGGFHTGRRCFEDGDLHFRLAAGGARLRPLPRVLEWSLRHKRGAGADQCYCFQCRLCFLEDYAALHPARLHPAIAAEAEHAAVQLLQLGDPAGARRAIALARALGRPVPFSHHPLIRVLRRFLPATLLLRWQHRWRRRARPAALRGG